MNIRIVLLCVGAALVLLCGSAATLRADQRAEDALLDAARASSEAPDTPGAQSEIEKRAIAAAPDFARRDGDRLILGDKGYEHAFPDVPECTDPTKRPCGRVKLVAYLESRGLILMLHTSVAGVHYVLADFESGNENVFYDLPYVSPSGEYVVARGEARVQSGEKKPNPNPHIALWNRVGLSDNQYYVPSLEAAPHYPQSGAAVYKLDRWVTESATAPSREGDVLFEGHLEVDGKTTARYQARYRKGSYEIVGAP